ncbi:MAG: hypothetical protein IT337_15285 [Thermomicrobiales bacterium]|nr:hypothetical protein [Thermomicrobiales bacterium]
MDGISEIVRSVDRRFWVLIGLCIALVYTIQAVEGAVEGFWPHQRRASRMAPGARAVMGAWSWVALLLLPGMLLAVLNAGIVLLRDLHFSQLQILGGLFLAVAWLVFVLVSLDAFGIGRFMGQVGPAGPAALMGMLLVGDVLLLIALLDILPGLDALRDALPDAGSWF